MRESTPSSVSRPAHVLALDTEWSSAHGGITTFNRQLCIALARAGARVFCVVLSATPDEVAEAARAGVTLIRARSTPGGSERDPLMRAIGLPGGVKPDLVIGHGRITGPAARSLVEDHYVGTARLHVVHTSPDETEWAKTDDQHYFGERAEDRVRVEKAIAQGATGIAAVGPRLYDQLVRDWSAIADPPLTLRLDPGFDAPGLADRTPPPGGPKQILILGRLEDDLLKGLDIAARAVAQAVGMHDIDEGDVEILLRGVPVGKHGELRAKFDDWAGSASLRIATRSYSPDPGDLREDLLRATLVLMPSRAEGFGLAGAEAITCGTPVLVSDRSGLGMVLKEVLPKQDAARMVIPVRNNDRDIHRWGAAIAAVLGDAEAAFVRANRVRRILATERSWSRAANEVLSVCSPRPGVGSVDDDTRQHWLSSVQLALPSGVECLFTGRERAIERITRWLTDREDRPVCVVTGDPGSGKSAVLAWLALGGDPLVSECLYGEAKYPPHPGTRIRATVYAKALSVQNVADAIAEQLGITCSSVEELHRELGSYTDPVGIVIDAVDESADAADLIKRLVQPIISRRFATSVRLILGARRHVASRLRMGVATVDLDGKDVDEASNYSDRGALQDYAYRILVTALDDAEAQVPALPERARRVARAIATSAGYSFLIAQLTCKAIVERGELPSPDNPFPDTVAQAMNDYLDALPVNRMAAEDLLRPLALAQGLGLPSSLWVRLAGELAGVPGKYKIDDLPDVFGGPLASLITSTRHADQGGPALGRPLYRLFHEALDEYMVTVPAAFPDAPQSGQHMREVASATLLASVPLEADRPAWSEADLYIRAHLLSHAAGTGIMRRLTRDAGFLVTVGREIVTRALPAISAADPVAGNAYEAVAQHQDSGTPLPERSAYLALGALKRGDHGLLLDWWPTRPAGIRWWPSAARWRFIVGHQIVHTHEGPVNGVAAVRAYKELLVVSGSDDATLAITGLPEAWADGADQGPQTADNDKTVEFGWPVQALAVAEVDGLPAVVAGTADGRLHVIDVPGGSALAEPTQPTGSAVSALLAVRHGPGWIAVAGHQDGRLCAWRIPPSQTPLTPPRSIDDTEIEWIVPAGPGSFLLATGSGVLWQWDIETGEVLRRSGDEPRVTALAGMPEEDRHIQAITGHDDGSVRFWPPSSRPATATVDVPGAGPILAITVARVGDRRLVLVAGEEDDVRIIDVASRELWPLALAGAGDPLWTLTATTVGGHPAAIGAGEDDAVHLWHLSGVDATHPHNDFIAERWSPSRLAATGPRLVTIAANEVAQFAILDAMAGERVAGPYTPPGAELLSTTALTVIGDEIWYAVGTEHGAVGVGKVAEPPVWASGEEQDWVLHAGFLMVGERPLLLSITSGGGVSLRDDLATRPRLFRQQRLEEPSGAVTAASTARDSAGEALLLAGDRAGRVGAWRLPDLTPYGSMRQIADEPITSVALAPSGGLVAGTQSGRLLVETAKGLVTRQAHRRTVTRTLVTRDLIVSGGEDGIVRAWRSASLEETPVTIDAGASIRDLLLTQDGALAISTHHGTMTVELFHP